MAERAMKKRKTEHVSSDEEDDNASFASFAGDDDGSEEEEMSGIEETLNRGAGEDSSDEEEAEKAVVKVKKDQKPKAAAASLASSAYTASTSKSSLFALQIDELLAQIRPSKHGKHEKAAETALHAIKKCIEQIAPSPPHLIADAERNLLRNKIAVPFPNPRPAADVKYKFEYAKPANINVVGSFALKTSPRRRDGEVEIDMVVAMPSGLFEEKDYLNYRYFYKRAFYLASLAAGLKAAHKGEYMLKFQLHHGNPLKPILVISPVQTEGKDAKPAEKWRVNIIPCALQDQFSADKLKLEKNCVRNVAEGEGEATPFYNSSLRSDMLMTAYLKLLHSASKTCEAFTDACLLGSTWLRQRSFGTSAPAGGFGNFEWNALMALCLQGGGANGKPILSSGYSSYQLFKATLQLLAMKDFAKHPLAIGTGDAPKALLDSTPLVWDTTRSHNVLYKMSQPSYRLLRSEAKSTLIALGDQLHDGFEATFILNLKQPVYRFDYTISLPSNLLHPSSGSSSDHTAGAQLQKLYSVLKQGLGERVTQISISPPSPIPDNGWGLGSSRPISKGNVEIHLLVNPNTVKRTVDHGPSAESKSEAKSFREFWGEKSELRRFKDGSILESLIWSAPSESDGQSVLGQIVCYLLNRHFGVAVREDITFSGDGFGKMLRGGLDITPFASFMEKYKTFENDVRELRDLPLSIRSLTPADPQLCYSSILPPGGNGRGGKIVPADVVLLFEGSGRWPDDLIAIQRTKIAFLLIISQMFLSSSSDELTTRIGLENETNPVLNQGFLDVTYTSTTCFRLRIFHEREQHLLQTTLSSKTSDPKSKEIAATGLAKYKRDYIVRPAQTAALVRLSTRFPALSGAVRLFKKWIDSHFLGNHIPQGLAELMVVRTFTQPAPYAVPTTSHTAFLRTLQWLARWDWRSDPLIVDFSTERGEMLTESKFRAIRTNFEAWRKLDPGMNRVAVFAASSVDESGVVFTEGVGKVFVGRMGALAKAACGVVLERGLEVNGGALFDSGVEDFDFVLHLKGTAAVKGKFKAGGGGFKNLTLGEEEGEEMIGYDPVFLYLAELEEVYGSAVLFFRGEDVIAGLWNPTTKERKGWKVNLALSTIPVKNGEGVVAEVNREGMLSEMARLGGDLVQRIETL